MNWHQGLQRINTVFWGFWIVCALLFVARGMFMGGSGGGEIAGAGLIGALVAWAALKLMRWVISGFFGV